ncbi:MAG: ATP-grasp domain-containing protein [Phreatobacter sp.]|nr:ATP-grasp domain-containing protein [Phreatobacter sp.]
MAGAIHVIIKPRLTIGPDFANCNAIDAAATRVKRWLDATNHNLKMDIVQSAEATNKDDVERLGRYDAIFRMISEHKVPAVISTTDGRLFLNGADKADYAAALSADGSHPPHIEAMTMRLRCQVDNIFHREVPYAFSSEFQKRCGRNFTLAAIGEPNDPSVGELPSYLDVARTMPLPFAMKTVTRQKASSVVFVEAEDERADLVWTVMHLEGHVAAFQSMIDIVSEHRCLVVDGEIKAIVLQKDELTFATPGPKIAFHDELLPLAEKYVRGLLKDPSLGRSFTMDLARLTNEDVVIMELNPLGGAGFFDADVDVMIADMASLVLGTKIPVTRSTI